MKIFKLFILLLTFYSILSCSSAPKLDCSDLDSIDKMEEQLTEEEKTEFQMAMFYISMSKLAEVANEKKDLDDPEALVDEAFAGYCGLTAKQIIDKVSKINIPEDFLDFKQ